MHRQCRRLCHALWVAALITGSAPTVPLRAADLVKSAKPSPAKARLERVAKLVESSNALELIGSRRWKTLLDEHRDDIEACDTHVCFAREVNELIAATGPSHFHYYMDGEWAYWHLLSALVDGGPNSYAEHIGVVPQQIDGRWYVRGVLEGSPAADTRVRVGDEILSVDGQPYVPIQSFKDKTGTSTRVRLRRRPGLIYNIVITPVKESLHNAVLKAMRQSIDIVEHDGLQMAYLHGWSMLGNGREYALLAEIEDEVDGLLLDYRDGHGGMWSAAVRFLLGRRSGRNKAYRNPTWGKPVVILTADGTRSAKEIVVHAVQREGRAPLVGVATPGHVTTVGSVRHVGENGLLMLPGRPLALEGKPTYPDYYVERDVRYCAGRDIQLLEAKGILADLIRKTRERNEADKPAASSSGR